MVMDRSNFQVAMTKRETSASPSPPILAQARRWWTLMRDDAEVAEHMAAFNVWLEADDRHMAAFEYVCTEQRQPQHRSRGLFAWLPAPFKAPKRAAALAVAASVAILAALPAMWNSPDVAIPASAWETRQPADGSVLQFGPGSRAWMAFSDKRRDIRLDSGSVIVEAAKDPRRPMIVRTAHGSVRVVGTRFTVIVDATGTEVSVSRGKVEASAAGIPGEVAPVTAAQRVRLSASGISRQTAPVTAPEEIRDGWRTLTAAPLADLTAAIQTETGHAILAMPSAAERSGRISGRFFLRDAEGSLALLTTAYHLHRVDAPFGVTILY